MSSSTVRNTAEACVTDAGWPAGLPFRETNDQVPDEGRPTPGVDAAWCTLAFDAEADERLGIGAETLKRETGSVFVFCMGDGHKGDDALLALAEAAKAAIEAFDWGSIFLVRVDPPDQLETDQEAWAAISIRIAYEFDHA